MGRKSSWLAILIVIYVLAGCAGQQAAPAVTPAGSATPTVALTPYRSATPRPQRSPTRGSTATPLPTMTPTPLSYKVVKGDDMFGIALRHGIPLATLLTANPTVNPSFLSVGTILQIPQVLSTPKPGESTPEPEAVELGDPACYPTAEGGLWCLVLASNPGEKSLENVSISVLAAGDGGSPLQQQEAYPLVYLIPPRASLALGAYFPPPAPQQAAASASVITAFYQPDEDARYAAVTITGSQTSLQAGGIAAQVSGSVTIADGENPVDEIWVAATAYDAAGRPVGLRRWEAHGAYQAGETLKFEFLVYSLGPAIARVDLLAEAHTSLEPSSSTPTTPAP